MRWYLRVVWSHDFGEEPVEILGEIGSDGYECRKVERFRGGRAGWAGWADEKDEVGGTGLGEVPVPPLAEINAQPEFVAVRITGAEFGRAWRRALGGR
ncbi:hypothetical protein NQK81_09905 [Amycolatopsis roodepoortensis]|uniref:DUF6881 domain-containing protein n=1 Tax=Amycolatopsis roodepoortensis TaxID=700274 RepID=UPI00214ADE33|nr:hypothetical protein [Amycolatopsis roodepoortensis]UUV33745.1 hypothetical protein NQK81_09905 [Amycolatopsis roodepoortensis]